MNRISCIKIFFPSISLTRLCSTYDIIWLKSGKKKKRQHKNSHTFKYFASEPYSLLWTPQIRTLDWYKVKRESKEEQLQQAKLTTISNSVTALPSGIQKLRLIMLPARILYFYVTSQKIWIAISHVPTQL